MTLQQKFFLLVSMLALAILGSLGAALFAFGHLQRELATPFSHSTTLLDALWEIKRNTEDQSRLLHAHGISKAETEPRGRWGRPEPFVPTPEQIAAYRQLAVSSRQSIARIDADDALTSSIGVSTWRNLRGRVADAASLADRWFSGTDPDAQAHASDACFAIHELIERTEGQVLLAAQSAVFFGDDVRDRLWAWLGSVLAVGLLGSVLAVAFLRRWVRQPVRALREAAAHIARGDLQHRVPVRQRDELGLLSAEVNHMAEMVQLMQDERVDRERLAAVGEVMRRVVHNVRNPLAGIRGLAEVTRLDFPPGTPNRENMDLIVSTVDAFERWLSELLDATSPASIQLRETNVREWIAGIVEIHRSQAVARHMTVHLDADAAPETASFDPKHMDHALSALVSNAIEASPENGDIWITAAAVPDADPPAWEVRVADRGPGIPADVLPRIFQPNFTTKRRGTGLGLAMAHQIVKGHAGRISVTNADPAHPERSGATFRISLPVTPPLPAADNPNTPRSS